MRLILLAPALLLIAATPTQQRDRIPAATPAGEPVSCISAHAIRETRVRSDKVIDFVMAGGKVYRNELPYGCPGLGFEQRFSHDSSIDRYCSVDTITVLQGPDVSRGATCGLGTFQPVALDKAH